MAEKCDQPARNGWVVPCIGLAVCLLALGLSAITTMGSRSNQTFQTVGHSLSASGGGYHGGQGGPIARAPVYEPPTPVYQHPPTFPPPAAPAETGTAAYDRINDSPFLPARDQPLSTFSVNVDTASYSNMRGFLNEGRLPPADAVRVADFVNYFAYDYPEPAGAHPVSIAADVAGCPWQPAHRLIRIGLRARRLDVEALPPRNLVFLVDVSGSMDAPKRLPLVKAGLNLLVDRLTAQDNVAIVVYAGRSGIWLRPTPGNERQVIRRAIDRLSAGGSTNGGAGIVDAYRVAQETFLDDGINRVILCTDGDFNVGVTSQADLVRLIEEKRKSGVYLTILGFGMDNLKDATLEKLADKGAGHYAYIDSLAEARKVFVEEGAALVTVAKDVKVQVEFNPATVAAYRLVGYENRLLRAQDFNDDQKNATPMGAGHTVTALYEVVPPGRKSPFFDVDPLKYQQGAAPTAAADGGDLLTVKVRYKEPRAETSQLLSAVVKDGGASFARAPQEMRFAAAAAAFGQLLRNSQYKGNITYAEVARIAQGAAGLDGPGHRAEFVRLVEKAARIGAADRQVRDADGD